MKFLLKSYLTLSTSILMGALILIGAEKISQKYTISPTAPTAQYAQSFTEPDITSDETGIIVKLQGFQNSYPSTISAITTIESTDNLSFTLEQIILEKGENGRYYGRITPPQPIPDYMNNPIKLLIKPEKHLQRRFFTTLSFNNYTDLTHKPIESGDIASFQDGTIIAEPDGHLDKTDINYIKSNIFSNNTSADLNYDGVVNAGDLSIIIDTLSSKADEN